jgi:sulfonate transport system ATP-binding protein
VNTAFNAQPRLDDFPETDDIGLSLVPTDLVVSLRNVVKRFRETEVLRGLDLDIRRGEFVALLGTSGSGKTTLLRILSSLETATDGDLSVAQNISVVFQEPRLLPFRRVAGNVLFGLSRKQRSQVDVKEALAEVGLSGHLKAWPKSLSGGEAQRVALARALIHAPDLLLLDEPLAALDALTRIRMQNLVLKLWEKHRPGILFITHDVEEALALADRAMVLKEGKLTVGVPLKGKRPRDRSSVEFKNIRKILLRELGVVEV